MNRLRIGFFTLALGVALFLGQTLFGFAETGAPLAGPEVVDVGNTICPITGKSVNPKATAVYKGKRYSFCCKNCVKKFEKNPEKYLAQKREEKPVEKDHAGHEHEGHEHAGG